MNWSLDKGIVELIKGLKSIKRPENFMNVK